MTTGALFFADTAFCLMFLLTSNFGTSSIMGLWPNSLTIYSAGYDVDGDVNYFEIALQSTTVRLIPSMAIKPFSTIYFIIEEEVSIPTI